jgi:hypothetical protein
LIVLDENLPDNQRQLLRSWRVPVRQVGWDFGQKGMTDSTVISTLHRHRSVTFFTRDSDYFDHRLCHSRYCLVCLGVEKYEAVSFARRVLRHPAFNTWAKRKARVLFVTHTGIRSWSLHDEEEEFTRWVLGSKGRPTQPKGT